MIAVILTHLPDEYSAIKTLARKEARKKQLDLEDLMDDIKAVFRTDISGIKTYEFGQSDEEMNGNSGNRAMTAATSKRNHKYDLTCGYCKKKGHKTEDCFFNPQSNNYRGKKSNKMVKGEDNQDKKSKFVPTCHICGKIGHIAPHCRNTVSYTHLTLPTIA